MPVAKRPHSLLTLAALALLASLVGCNGGGGSGGSQTANLRGSVVDGYVADARVTVYRSSDLSAQNRIGSGRTNGQGRFNLTLNVGRIPYPLYIKTEGGTDLETGLPAPTMLFVGEDQGGEAVVTPLTDMHSKLAMLEGYTSGGLVLAEDRLLGRLNGQLQGGRDLASVFGDPEQDGLLKNALDRVLASGTQSATLPDGEYTVAVAHIDNTKVNNASEYTCTGLADFRSKSLAEGNMTVAGHILSGRVGGFEATGHIQGGSFVLDLNATGGLIRLAGTIGLMGCAAGTFIDIPETAAALTDISRGPFAASFMPKAGLDADAVKDLAARLYSGKKNLLFRDTLGRDYDIGVASDLTITEIDPSTLAVNASDFHVFLAPDNETSAEIRFVNGTFLQTSGGQPTGLIALEFEEPNASSDLDLFIQPIGLRQGLYLVSNGTTNEVYAAGEAYLSSSNSTTPHLQQNEPYYGSIMAVALNATGQNRGTVLSLFDGAGFSTTPSEDPLAGCTMKDVEVDFGFNSSVNATAILSGGMLGLYHSNSMGALNPGTGLYAQRAIMEIFETGAMQGTGIFGSSNQERVTFPCPYVGFALKASAPQAPSFNGRLNFLYRILYVADSEIGEIKDISYAYGTLDINGSSALLRYTDSQGETGQAILAVDDRETGLYHIHGPIGPSGQAQYTDIFWPVGGTKGAVLVSSGTGTNEPIVEVGEAFMSF